MQKNAVMREHWNTALDMVNCVLNSAPLPDLEIVFGVLNDRLRTLNAAATPLPDELEAMLKQMGPQKPARPKPSTAFQPAEPTVRFRDMVENFATTQGFEF